MEIIGYLISNLFRVYLVYKFFKVFFSECRVSKQWELLVYGMYYCVNSCVYLIICMPVCTLIINVVGAFALTMIYSASIKQRIFCIIMQNAIFICAELIVTYLIVDVFPVFFYKNQPQQTIMEYVMANLSTYPLIITIEKRKKISRGEDIPIQYWVLVLTLPLISLYIIVVLGAIQIQYRIPASISLLGLLAVNLIAFSLYDKILQAMQNRIEEAKIEEQNHSYKKQLDIYQESMERTSIMRHDWKNHLAVISNMAESNNDKEVVQYVNALMKSITNSKMYSNSGNSAVDAIVNYKCEEAVKCGISVEVSIQISSDITVEAIDISTIIGNLMDNAICAAQKVNNHSYIYLSMKEQQGNLSIRIANPYINKLKIYNGKYQTTKVNKEEHGIGLAHIKKIVDKYHGVLKIDTQQKVFDVHIILFE